MSQTLTSAEQPGAVSAPGDGLTVGLATDAERELIYALRHRVYAAELRQHAATADGRLTDAIDAHNFYMVARRDGGIVGFVSVTPPGGRYSLDKYLTRSEWPFACDEWLYEVRLLTVLESHRGGRIALLLMLAALDLIESGGGTRIAAIVRLEVLPLYRKVGLQTLGIRFHSGAVEYELMTATVSQLRGGLAERDPRKLRNVLGRSILRDRPHALPDFSHCYHGGAFFDAIGPKFEALERRHAIINADVLDAPFDPAPGVLTALRDHLPWLLRTSPPVHCQGLIQAIAETRGVSPASILPGGGSSDLIYLALRHWLNPQSRVLILDPMYGEYAHVLERLAGCKVDRLTLRRENDYDLLPEQLCLRAADYDMVVLVNPNSPTGRHLTRAAVEQLIAAVPPTTRFWIDETYVDYVDGGTGEQSLEGFACRHTNVVVCKSMSKVYALSGARVAYLCGPRALIEPLRVINPPWAVSLTGQVAAVAALRDPVYYRACYAQVAARRDSLFAALQTRFGFDVVPGVANFLLCHLPQAGPTAAALVAACRPYGLFLRDVSLMGSSLGDRALRLAVKDETTNQRMLEILAHVLGC